MNYFGIVNGKVLEVVSFEIVYDKVYGVVDEGLRLATVLRAAP